MFALYVTGVVLLPWPLGSNRGWAWGGFEIWFGLLLLGWVGLRALRWQPLDRHQWLPLLLLWAGVGVVAMHSLPGACGPLPGSQALEPLGIVRSHCTLAVDPDGQSALLGQVLLAALVASLALLLLDSWRRVRILLVCLIVGSALAALLGTFAALTGQHFGNSWVRIGDVARASGPFINPNHFAGHLEIVLGLGVGLLLGLLRNGADQRSWRQLLRDWLALLLSRKAALRGLLVLLVVALVSTRSRSGNVAFMVALLLGGVLALLMRQRPRSLLWLFGSMVLIDLVIVGGWFGFDRVVERAGLSIGVGMDRTEGSVAGLAYHLDAERAEVRAAAWAMWQQAPLLGLGGGAFRALYPAHREAQASALHYDHVHNDHVQALAEVGIVGYAWALLLVGGALVAAVRAVRRRRRRELQGLAVGASIAVVALLFHGLTDFNLQIPANQAYFALALVLCWLSGTGFAVRTHGRHARADREVQGGSRLPVLLVAGLCCGAAIPAAQATVLAQTCRTALAQTARTAQPVPLVPEVNVAELRRQIRLRPADEELRQQAAALAIAGWRAVLGHQANGSVARAIELTEWLQTQLADTGWRIQRLARDGSLDAALALRARIQAGLEVEAAEAVACATLERAREPLDRVQVFERALCRMRQAPAAALVDMQSAAGGGHTGAQEALAQLCLRARKPDPGCAVQWLCRAAPRRPSAAAAAAFLLVQEPVADLALVEQFYRDAAAAGDAASANNLGEMFERGMKGQVDYRQAEDWYRQAADAGLAEGKLNLARLWLERDGDNPRAHGAAAQLLKSLVTRFPTEVAALKRRFAISTP